MNNCIGVLLFAAMLLGSTLAASLTPQNEEFRSLPGGGWLKLHQEGANWLQALEACRLEGGALASPLTPQLAEALRGSARGLLGHESGGLLTGLHAAAAEKNFTSVEGTMLDSIPHRWAIVQLVLPNAAERCLALLPDGTLTASDCNQQLPFACYRENMTAPEDSTNAAHGNETTGLKVCSANGTIDNEYTLDARTGSCYKLHLVARPWARAAEACEAEGAWLVVVNSDAEAQAVHDLFARYPSERYPVLTYYGKSSAFAGFHKLSADGDWITVHGESLEQAGFSRFVPGEPNNPETELCGAVGSSGYLGDHNCNVNYRFICEKLPLNTNSSVQAISY